jgi:AcrR family transcriptional regulator
MTAKKEKAEEKLVTTERGEATRARLIETAYALFLKKGFHGTSLRDIAEGAGVAVGGIYNHFQDKEEIFAVVLDTYHPYHTLLPAALAIRSDTVESYIRQLGRMIYKSLTDAESQLLPLIFIELVEFQGRHMLALLDRAVPTVWEYMEARFKTMRGRLRAHSVPLIARTYICLIIGMVLTEMVLRDAPLFKPFKTNWLEGAIDIFLHGVMEPEA